MPKPIDEFASDFLERAIAAWRAWGLPDAALATACTTWGLETASREEGPAEVAAGLQRMADAIMEAHPAPERKHLI